MAKIVLALLFIAWSVTGAVAWGVGTPLKSWNDFTTIDSHGVMFEIGCEDGLYASVLMPKPPIALRKLGTFKISNSFGLSLVTQTRWSNADDAWLFEFDKEATALLARMLDSTFAFELAIVDEAERVIGSGVVGSESGWPDLVRFIRSCKSVDAPPADELSSADVERLVDLPADWTSPFSADKWGINERADGVFEAGILFDGGGVTLACLPGANFAIKIVLAKRRFQVPVSDTDGVVMTTDPGLEDVFHEASVKWRPFGGS
jgi:hypothetical protein